ncbi:MAG: SCO family protein [Gammaproteobacteria bacterium]|nr:SCO family protein [Gammaproteobacteria bacterium]
MKKYNHLYFWIVVICFFGGILLAQQFLKQQGSDLIPGAGGNFTLQADQGPVALSDFKGKVVALYFGYMSCPDICPTSLWNLSAAMNSLTREQAEQVQGLFISVDPERDSPYALNLFVKGFFDSFLGLTGLKSEIDKIARQYGVIYEKVPLPDSAMGYVIDHTSVIYLIDQQGVLQYYLPHNTDPESIKNDLLKLLEE